MVETTRAPEQIGVEERLQALERRAERGGDPNQLTIVVFSDALDRLLAAFTLATGAAACGKQVTMFFTFWGTSALKRGGPQARGKTLVERLFGWMLPGGFRRRRLSRLHLGGLGRLFMRREMRRKGVADVEELIEIAKETGVRVLVCEMAMSLMGIRQEELIDYPGLRPCGVASYLDIATQAGTSLFI